MFGKRGELTSEQLIAIILVILGFVIVVSFFTQFGAKDYSEDEICKFSVLSRATASEVVDGAGNYIPLQCTTNKICLVAGGDGECPQFAGEKDVSYVRVPSYSVDKPEEVSLAALEISRVLAESTYNCWNLMGQGKLDLFNSVPDGIFPDFRKQSTCVICSRVAVGSDINNEVLARVDVSNYLKSTTIPGGSRTYLQVMTDDQFNSYVPLDESKVEKSDFDLQQVRNNNSAREKAIVFMQFKSQDPVEVIKTQLQIGAGVGGTAFAFTPGGVLSFASKASNLVYTAAAVVTVAGLGAASAYAQQQTAVGYCGQLTTNDKDSRDGCSIVQTLNYNVQDIKNLCGSLQGSP